ncbi:T9SS type B sorting domain-containing protein [Flavobacterium panacagri]|uniref:DUF7948 domain-containing protein n=1 Tax=Flavobacterium panacagri TaxID=3034146 RepID=UPI0025A5DB77|nr:T9SS type B sorting domain-containing protein [Flavobacterium panacagri]
MKQKLLFLFLFLLVTVALFSQNKNQSIGFKENKGQIVDQNGKLNTAVKYLLNTNGLNVQLKTNGFSYDVYEVKRVSVINSNTAKTLPYSIPEKEDVRKEEFKLEYIFHRIDIDFTNSNPNVELVTQQKSGDFDNYYNIPNKLEGIIGVHQYKQVTYKNIYPNIDAVFTIPDDPKKTVEYNFVIHPKGKISDIKLKFNGAETNLDNNKILMDVRFGKIEETLPASWIEDGENKKEIAVEYIKIKKNLYGFNAPKDVSGKTIIIDPVPTRLWGTYYGGEELDYARSLFSKDDFVYMAGTTYSKNNIASSGAFQTSLLAEMNYDSYFVKFNSDGTRVWGTYYGGNNTDEILKIKVSNSNNIFIAGRSLSPTNIATPLSHQPVKSGYFDGFIAKFDSNGVREWGTYYGGLLNESINSILIDSNENFYVCGETNSKESISTIGAHQTTAGNLLDSTTDGFIAKFNSDGLQQWATYYGGNNLDVLNDCGFDSDGNIIFLGYSRSPNNIATEHSYQETIIKDDGFLVKFTPDGNRIWGTYFGGENNDYFYNIGLDSDYNIYCFGKTNSVNNISSPGVFQETYIESSGNYSTGCLIKFNNNGQKLWGSYFFPEILGGSVTKSGSIYFAGRAESGFQATENVFQETQNSGTKSYLVKFNTNGQREWATYFGGEMADNASTVYADNNFNIFLGGSTNSKTNIATPGTHQENLYPDKISYQPNTADAFLVKFKDCDSNASISSNSPICFGKTLELRASGGNGYTWTGPNGFTSSDQNPIITNVNSLNNGEYTCTLTGSDLCNNILKIKVTIGDIESPIPNLAILPIITGDCNTTITSLPTATDACAGQITGTTTSPLSYNLPGNYTIIWNYTDGNGNTSTQNQIVTITGQPLPSADPLQIFCVDQNAGLNDIQITGENVKWYSNLTGGTLVPITTLLQDKATYYASQTINGCESDRVPVKINIQVTFPPTGDANQQFCTGQNPTIANLQVTGNSVKWYNSSTNGSLLAETTNLENGKTYYASQTENSCESPRFEVRVSIVNTPSVPSGNPTQEFCKNENPTLENIPMNGQNLKWYDTNFSATPLPNTTLLENNRTYYASQTIGCEGDRTPILIKVHDTPAPTGNNSQQFCIDEIATLENLNITGTNIKWYDSATAGNILPETTLLQNAVYYAAQTLNSCESDRFAVNVKIQDTQIPIADSPQIFCIQKNAKISDIDVSGQSKKWYESISSNTSISESTLLENGMTYYVSQTISNCESDRIPVSITILGVTTGDCINFVDELPFPKFFTPNGDGYNDIWTIDAAYLAPGTGIKIYDRYGKLIKELAPNTSWNGTYLGNLEPASDYWFLATRFNGTEFRGHFSLKR